MSGWTGVRRVVFFFSLAALMFVAPAPGLAGAVGFVGGPLPAPPGRGLATNQDVEPNIAVDGAGEVWIASTNGLEASRNHGGAQSGTDVWRSRDGGRTYAWSGAPFASLPARNGFGGGETDIAAALERNSSGHFNLYVASIYVTPGPNFAALSVSKDGGATWQTTLLGGLVPLADRPWVTADGACTVYLTYHDYEASLTWVERLNACGGGRAVVNTVRSTRLPQTLPAAVTGKPAPFITMGYGKPVVDRSPTSSYRHRLYVPAVDCTDMKFVAAVSRGASAVDRCPGATQVEVQLSPDGGKTWRLVEIARGSDHTIQLWPVGIATDAAGGVYLAYSDATAVYLVRSFDGGMHWTKPVRVDQAPSRSAIYPRVAASATGRVDVAWYGASRAGDSNDVATMGAPGAVGAASWRVFRARSTNSGQAFTQDAVTGTVATGAVCTQIGCPAANGTTDLGNDFGFVALPATGLDAFAYTGDQAPGRIGVPFTGYATEVP